MRRMRTCEKCKALLWMNAQEIADHAQGCAGPPTEPAR